MKPMSGRAYEAGARRFTVGTGQTDVEDNADVRLEAGPQRPLPHWRSRPSRRDVRRGPEFGSQQVACVRVVIDSQYPLGTHGTGESKPRRPARRRWRNGPRQLTTKRLPVFRQVTRRGLHLAMDRRTFLRPEAEPQPSPPRRWSRAGPARKGSNRLGTSSAGTPGPSSSQAIRILSPDTDATSEMWPPGGVYLGGVGQEVGEHLDNSIGVAIDHQSRTGNVDFQRVLLLRDQRSGHVDGAVNSFPQLERRLSSWILPRARREMSRRSLTKRAM